jgi:hypothetical protein
VSPNKTLLCLSLLLSPPHRDVFFVFFLFILERQTRSQLTRGLRCRSAAARLLRLWVRIPPGAWMSVCCECCVLSGRGRPEKPYRLWCVVVCDLETSWIRKPWPSAVSCVKKNWDISLSCLWLSTSWYWQLFAVMFRFGKIRVQDAETNLYFGVHCSIYDSLVMTSSRPRFPSVREFAELRTLKCVLTYVVIYFVIVVRTFDN